MNAKTPSYHGYRFPPEIIKSRRLALLPILFERQYFWRAVDQDGDVIDILVQPRLSVHMGGIASSALPWTLSHGHPNRVWSV